MEYTDCISADEEDPTKERSEYDHKLFNREGPVMQELWKIRSTSLLPSLPGPPSLILPSPDKVLSMGQIELLVI